MPNGHVLELSALPTIHPRAGLLQRCATSTIIRLSVDPTPLHSGTMVRAVIVDWLARPGGKPSQAETRDIGWSNLPEYVRQCDLWPFTVNAHTITEDAAIGVMALLIHDLERAEIRSVLQIGSGGDYLLAIPGVRVQMQVECSGIRTDPGGSMARTRIGQKCQQVLTKCRSGFASVTTFSHGPGEVVHSYLHFVTVPPKKGRGKKGRRK